MPVQPPTPSEPVVRAIDVGYGQCKYVERVDGERIVCQAFPALAPLASERDLGVDRRTRRQTVVVPVGKTRYEVGPEASLAQSAFDTRHLDDHYCLSDAYLALMRGALRLMRLERIELLVVGLPVSLYKSHRAALEKRLQGQHEVGEARQVEVARVLALAQPMGAFLGHAVPSRQRDTWLGERNLIVDPGWRTFDWVVTQGLKVLDKRSDAVNKGMHDVVAAIAQAIGAELGCRLNQFDHERIDLALRRRGRAKFYGRPFEIEPYAEAGRRVVDEALTAMRQLVQDGSDIDNILLAGGGAFFFRPGIERGWPQHRLQVVAEPVFANVRGFQIAGMEWLAHERRRHPEETS